MKHIIDKLIKVTSNIIERLKGFILGNKYYCPCCDKTCRRFIEISKNSFRCPYCGCLGRHRALALYLQNNSLLTSKIKMLEIGPNHALKLMLRSRLKSNYISIGFSNIVDFKADVTDVPFRDNVFDLVLCSHVLEHIQNDFKAMQEMFRVLKPGGMAIILVPLFSIDSTYEDFSIISAEGRLKAFGQFDHVRKCGKDYASRLERAKFDVESKSLSDGLDIEIINRSKIGTNEIMFLCKKASTGISN